MLFWIRGKRAEDSEVVVIVRSRRLKVKIKELFNLERNGASTRERKAVGMRRARDILQLPSGPDRGESHEIRTQWICNRYNGAELDVVLHCSPQVLSASSGSRKNADSTIIVTVPNPPQATYIRQDVFYL